MAPLVEVNKNTCVCGEQKLSVYQLVLNQSGPKLLETQVSFFATSKIVLKNNRSQNEKQQSYLNSTWRSYKSVFFRGSLCEIKHSWTFCGYKTGLVIRYEANLLKTSISHFRWRKILQSPGKVPAQLPFNVRPGHCSDRYSFGHSSPAAIARELFKPSTDSARLLVSTKKSFDLGLGFSVGDVTKRSSFWIFDQFYQALGANSMSHFLAQTFCGNQTIIRVFRALGLTF